MHNTNHYQDGYCLLYYVKENFPSFSDPSIQTHQIIPFCLRSSEENILIEDLNLNNTFDSKYTFAELREKNVGSQMLLNWSASMDLAERYEMFLNNLSQSSFSEYDMLFYNCTSKWFGPFCRFGFNVEVIVSPDDLVTSFDVIKSSFGDIVDFNFRHKESVLMGTKVTCYEHINCTTFSVCLDWREICDRKIDCDDGSDEFNCWQLEINECAENEYRCYNGQCIPGESFHDVYSSPDCLDRTDEPVTLYTINCRGDPAFRCEEHTCRPASDDFPCGDGTCTNGISRCHNGRDNVFANDSCSYAMSCLMKDSYLISAEWCQEFCVDSHCLEESCPAIFEFSSHLMLFGHVHFMFTNKEVEFGTILLPDYVCYDEKLCADLLLATVKLNASTCCYVHQLGLKSIDLYEDLETFVSDVKELFRGCRSTHNDTKHYYNYSAMYRCENSTKYISKYRLVDTIRDCPFNDDETFNESCLLNNVHHRFKCQTDNQNKCFAPLIIQDEKIDCADRTDEVESHIYFQRICDGIEDVLPVLIDGQNETDETHCQQWPCNNTYTRCDEFWSCPNRADEVNCPSSPCPVYQHSCVFPNDTSKMSCLPITQAGDGIIDCLGASDEPNYCRDVSATSIRYLFRCWNHTECNYVPICNKRLDCPLGDDERFCWNSDSVFSICWRNPSTLTEVERFFCKFQGLVERSKIGFILQNIPTYLLELSSENISHASSTEINTQSIHSNPIMNVKYEDSRICNQGLPIDIRMEDNMTKLSCLCPPSYYGDQCQFQNQRVSLTLEIRMTSDWRHVFTFLIMLIDHEENIESHDYIEYLAIRDCDTKFNIYLLYSSRPKNRSKNYFLRINAFNKNVIEVSS